MAAVSARKLEQDLNTMTDTFYNLVRAAYVTEERDEGVKQEKKPSGEMAEVLAQKLVVAGQSVLTLISELKRQALLSDYAALNRHAAEQRQAHGAAAAAAEQRIRDLEAELRTEEAARLPEGEEVPEEGEDELRRLYLLAQEVPLPAGDAKS